MSSINTGQSLDKQAKLYAVKHQDSAARARRRYDQLRRGLAHLGYISQGSVQDRTARKGGGAGYQWTRKVLQKTVTVSLTDQFARLKEAVTNYRKLRSQLKEMERISRQIIFRETPHANRHKRLSPKVLGTN